MKIHGNGLTEISELLTHDIFDYSTSMEYLKHMQHRGIISEEERQYIEVLCQNFKTDELINNRENELLDVTGEGEKLVQPRVPRLTIDPQIRLNYLRSLGAVKKLRVRGETFLKDSPENSGKRNSLDGYEMFIIPSKKIAVLEKLYETTRDKQGNIVYRKNKNGELIPAIENATYFIPIAMAKDFVEKKNKRDLIKSPFVERVYHTADWVVNCERKMHLIVPSIELSKENSKKWDAKVRENYTQNKEDMSL